MLINRLTCPLPLGWDADDPIIFIFSVAMASSYAVKRKQGPLLVWIRLILNCWNRLISPVHVAPKAVIDFNGIITTKIRKCVLCNLGVAKNR